MFYDCPNTHFHFQAHSTNNSFPLILHLSSNSLTWQFVTVLLLFCTRTGLLQASISSNSGSSSSSSSGCSSSLSSNLGLWCAYLCKATLSTNGPHLKKMPLGYGLKEWVRRCASEMARFMCGYLWQVSFISISKSSRILKFICQHLTISLLTLKAQL